MSPTFSGLDLEFKFVFLSLVSVFINSFSFLLTIILPARLVNVTHFQIAGSEPIQFLTEEVERKNEKKLPNGKINRRKIIIKIKAREKEQHTTSEGKYFFFLYIWKWLCVWMMCMVVWYTGPTKKKHKKFGGEKSFAVLRFLVFALPKKKNASKFIELFRMNYNFVPLFCVLLLLLLLLLTNRRNIPNLQNTVPNLTKKKETKKRKCEWKPKELIYGIGGVESFSDIIYAKNKKAN